LKDHISPADGLVNLGFNVRYRVHSVGGGENVETAGDSLTSAIDVEDARARMIKIQFSLADCDGVFAGR
jgi:hypothetical protein